ncbi:MAG TPA: polyprenyl synthetase family protein [Gammaproteobacteria bacterium]|nr:polyprenyl synthetase family protein [Gammaproteobacteria bacterium]
MAAVNQLIEASLYSEVPLIDKLAHHIINSGGKRLRPAIALLAARACGYRGSQHVTLAAIVEFIHTATLLHDDVVDASELRRGRQTANHLWGNSASVLVGDFLYSRAFQMMVGVNDMRVMSVLADATNTIAAGEVMQLANRRNPDTTREQYFAVITAKTAKLFEAAAQLGAVLTGRGMGVEAALAAYGRHVGIAYQLIDDVLDYSGSPEVCGKNVGDDLAEGKPTLPLLHALWHSKPAQAQTLRTAIKQGGRENIAAITAAIESTGAIAHAAGLARTEAQEAVRSLEVLPPSADREALRALAEFTVNRSL